MSDAKVVDVFKALADPTRLQIIRNLASCQTHQKSCTALSSKADLSQPAMSHHFGKLVDAGVILETKNGTHKIYSLNKKLLEGIGIDAAKLQKETI